MANFKVVVSDPKSRKAFQKEMEQKASGLMGKRIGDKVKGDALGLSGYELQVTGGSDAQGFPMRKDVEGIGRKRLLLGFGPGFHPAVKGMRKRKSVRGNTISSATSQVNVKVVTHGSKPLEQLIGKAEKKEKLTEEEKKKKLQEELAGKVEEKAPEKSASEKILEEKEAKEKAEKGEQAKEPKEEKPAEPEAKGKKEEKPAKEEPAEEKKAEPEEKPKEEKK